MRIDFEHGISNSQPFEPHGLGWSPWSSNRAAAASVPTIFTRASSRNEDFPGRPGERRDGQPGGRADAVPGVGKSRQGHLFLHQLLVARFRPAWRSMTPCSSSSRMCPRSASARRPHGRVPADRRCQGQALLPAELARDDPSAAGRFPGAGVGHRNPRQGNPVSESAPQRYAGKHTDRVWKQSIASPMRTTS